MNWTALQQAGTSLHCVAAPDAEPAMKSEKPQPCELSRDEFYRYLSTQNLPAGWQHIYDFVIAYRLKRKAPEAAEKSLVDALEAMFNEVGKIQYGQIDYKSIVDISSAASDRRVASLKRSYKVRKSDAFRAFSKALGLDKAPPGRKRDVESFQIALAYERAVSNGQSKSEAKLAIAKQFIANTRRVERAAKSHAVIVGAIVRSENESKALRELPVSQRIGTLADKFSKRLLGPSS